MATRADDPGFRPATSQLFDHLLHRRRVVFLDAISRRVRQVLTTLEIEVYPSYCEALGAASRRPVEALSWEVVHNSAARPATFTVVAENLLAWAQRWHLDTPWLLDAALLTLWEWETAKRPVPSRDPGGELRLPSGKTIPAYPRFAPGSIRYRPPPGVSHDEFWITFTSGYAWDPTFESRPKFAAHLRDEFERKLRMYLNDIEDAAEAAGLVAEPKQRASKHFEWLVQYQVLRRTYRGIARNLRSRERTIRQGIQHAADLVGLPLRAAQRGRPAKASTTRSAAGVKRRR